MDYKEQIEKEAYDYVYPCNPLIQNFHDGLYTGFISGVNSKIAERIRIEYAISVLEEIRILSSKPAMPNAILNKISELKKIDG